MRRRVDLQSQRNLQQLRERVVDRLADEAVALELDGVVRADEDVVARDVTVNDAAIVKIRQGVEKLAAVPQTASGADVAGTGAVAGVVE